MEIAKFVEESLIQIADGCSVRGNTFAEWPKSGMYEDLTLS
jgi:hypothetical protein